MVVVLLGSSRSDGGAAAIFDFDFIGSSGRRRELDDSTVLGVGVVALIVGLKAAGFELCLSTISRYLS